MSRKCVVRLIQHEGLKARRRKWFKGMTMSHHGQPLAGNPSIRERTASGPNQLGVGDMTEFIIGECGKLHLAAILDSFSRFTVGCTAMDAAAQ